MENKPNIGSPEWNAYWIDKLYPHEMTDKFPSTDGLRRVFGTEYAEVSSVYMDVILAPTTEQQRATVKCTIAYTPKGSQKECIISDVADCFWGNTKRPFCDHATATAATIAEGRCYRKAMYLKTLTQEESLNPSEEEVNSLNEQHEDNTPSSENQKNAIKRMAERVGIDLNAMVRYFNEDLKNIKTSVPENISSLEAKTILKQLNKWQRQVSEGGEQIPEIILKKGSVV